LSSVEQRRGRLTSVLLNIGKNLLLVFLSLIFALGLVEIALRIHNPLGFRVKGDKIILPINKNEIIHHAGWSKLDRTVLVHRNSLGFRGEEPPPDLGQRLSLMTVGGSTTECFELADNRTWISVLGEKLKNNFSPFWINNAGLSGHSTFGHIILMQDFIVKMKPKVVVFLVGVNDMGLEEENNADRNIHKGFTWSSFRSLERFSAALSDHSEVAAAVLNLKRYFFPKVTWAPTSREINLKTEPTLTMSAEAKAALEKDYQQKYVIPYEERLETLLHLCKENHILPVLVTQPALYGYAIDDVTGVDLSQVRVRKGINGGFYWDILEINNAVTRKVAQKEGVFLIDLAREMPKSSKYYYDLIHYDNLGAEKVGTIVYQHLYPYLAGKFPQYLRATASRTVN